MNCLIRMSLRLFGIAHRKKSAVTTRNGSNRSGGIKGASRSSAREEPTCPVEILKQSPPGMHSRSDTLYVSIRDEVGRPVNQAMNPSTESARFMANAKAIDRKSTRLN